LPASDGDADHREEPRGTLQLRDRHPLPARRRPPSSVAPRGNRLMSGILLEALACGDRLPYLMHSCRLCMRNIEMRSILLACFVFLASGTMSSLHSQPLPPAGSYGSVVQPVQSAPVRSEPPGGLLGLPGDEIGVTDPNAQYIITGAKDVPRLFGTDRWIQVTPVVTRSATEQQSGWVYWGASSEQSSPNFIPLE
jgi:hypothetical protein